MSTASAEITDREQAIRDYLTLLHDPESLVDDRAIADLQRQLDEATDPVERVKLRGEIDKLSQPATTELQEAFVTHAAQWAEEANVSADAFAAEGVPPEILRKAGFRVAGSRGRPKSSKGHSRSRQRQTPTGERGNVDTVSAWITNQGGDTFTISQAMDATGATRNTVVKAINQIGAAEVGTDPNHTGPGRSPKLYASA